MSTGVERARRELFAALLLANTGFAAQTVACAFRAALAAAEAALVELGRAPGPEPAAVVAAKFSIAAIAFMFTAPSPPPELAASSRSRLGPSCRFPLYPSRESISTTAPSGRETPGVEISGAKMRAKSAGWMRLLPPCRIRPSLALVAR